MKTTKSLLLASLLMFATALTSAASIVLNFDSVAGSGVDATSYLSSFGITLSNVSPGSVQIISDQTFYGGGVVAASSPHNFLMQNPGGSPNGATYTLNFSTPLTSVSFTRIAQTTSNLVAEWSATAYAGSTPVGSVGEGLFGGTEGSQTYTLSGSGITSLTIIANGYNVAGVPSPPLDDLTLTPGGPSITSPRNNAIPYSQFVALTGTGAAGSSLNVILNRTPVGSIVVDNEGHWEALVYLRALATGTTSTVEVCDQGTGLCSDPLSINDHLAFLGADAPPGGFIAVANRCLPLRRADIFVSGDPTSPQEVLYGPNYTHTALYLGGDANGTPFIAEAVTKSEAGKLGQVRSVRLEDSLVWLEARTAGFRPTDRLALSGSIRDAIVSRASAFTSENPPANYWNLNIFNILIGPHKLLHLLLKLEQTLRDLKPSTTEFICSTLVWHAYFDGTNQTLDISTPNNMTAQPGSMFDGLSPLIIDDLRPYLPVPETFATSPKLKQIF